MFIKALGLRMILKMLLPIVAIIFFIIFFCYAIKSASAQTSPPSTARRHSLNMICSFCRNLLSSSTVSSKGLIGILQSLFQAQSSSLSSIFRLSDLADSKGSGSISILISSSLGHEETILKNSYCWVCSRIFCSSWQRSSIWLNSSMKEIGSWSGTFFPMEREANTLHRLPLAVGMARIRMNQMILAVRALSTPLLKQTSSFSDTPSSLKLIWSQIWPLNMYFSQTAWYRFENYSNIVSSTLNLNLLRMASARFSFKSVTKSFDSNSSLNILSTLELRLTLGPYPSFPVSTLKLRLSCANLSKTKPLYLRKAVISSEPRKTKILSVFIPFSSDIPSKWRALALWAYNTHSITSFSISLKMGSEKQTVNFACSGGTRLLVASRTNVCLCLRDRLSRYSYRLRRMLRCLLTILMLLANLSSRNFALLQLVSPKLTLSSLQEVSTLLMAESMAPSRLALLFVGPKCRAILVSIQWRKAARSTSVSF